jgi:hypothetical protein
MKPRFLLPLDIIKENRNHDHSEGGHSEGGR